MRLALVGGSIVLISAGMFAIQGILAPFLFAIITGICVAPLFFKLVNKGWHKVLAAITSLVVVVLIFGSILLILLISMNTMSTELSAQLAGVEESNAEFNEALSSIGIDVDSTVNTVLDSKKMVEMAQSLMNELSALLGFAVLLFLFVLYMIFDIDAFGRVFRGLFGEQPNALHHFTGFTHNITSYVYTQAWTGAIVSTLDAIFLYLYGIPYPVLWGLLSFFMGFIPNIGFWIALIPPALLAYSMYGWQGVVVVVIVYNLVNGTMEIFIKPRVIGKSVSISTTVVFLSLTYWGFILGPWGGLLSIPLTLMLKNLVLDVYPGTRRLSALISLDISDAHPESAAVPEPPPAEPVS
jgi:predicted PurR-regulated permease PerM